MPLKNFILDMFFPKFCLSCQKEGDYLCQDCKATLGISGFHQKYKTSNLSDLYYPLSYQNKFIQNLIKKFKDEPLVKELAPTLSSLIIEHFQLADQKSDFKDFILIPLPLVKRRLKWRGYNQAEEIGKYLAEFFQIPLVSDVLIKIKTTLPQIELAKEKREENIRSAFAIKNPDLIQGKKILLVDDIYTTGATMEECARILREAGAKEIIGIVVARG
ncbi:MAG: ComF family protein [bacterium]|nr:ComF family protein [bacterium]